MGFYRDPKTALRLIKYGFIKSDFKSKYEKFIIKKDDDAAAISKKSKEFETYLKSLSEEERKAVESHADEEKYEEALSPQKSTKIDTQKTGYPAPPHRYKLVYEKFNHSIEESYYWILNYMKFDYGYPKFIKIIDVFTASEQSAFFGVAQQRLGLQQDRISGLLATVGKLVKDLFQMVREMRIIDERLDLYRDSYGLRGEKSEAAEISLKGYWIDLVEGGAKNPGSVFGLAREIGFTTLPDIFFAAPTALKSLEVDKYVDSLQFNRKVKEVLKRKLKTYIEWKERTFQELMTRRRFTLQYLRQHKDVIDMYMSWVKPYLVNIKRLQLDQKKAESVDLISAFEGSVIEIEFIAVRPFKDGVNSCALHHFYFRTRPQMSYQQEGYQRGPIHAGQLYWSVRGYGWTDEQLANYERMRREEDLELLGDIDSSVKAAMEALGAELQRYLIEAGEEIPEGKKESKEKPKLPTAAEPFTALFGGFGELFGSLGKLPISGDKKKGPKEYDIEKTRETALKHSISAIWNCYKNFKKAHSMLAW
ncbi:hypothetical protein HYU07_07375 [Candidatus Woesearchaeota archaeon]|nr:hypothetical protein [Candidatus Woesearchaeota archaeon]